MKYTVIGAGMMGSAAGYDLAHSNPADEIVLADINMQETQAAKSIGPNVKPLRLDDNIHADMVAVMTAMMRKTAFPTSIIAQMLAKGVITERGVLPPENCVPGATMIEELGKRNLKITRKVTEIWS